MMSFTYSGLPSRVIFGAGSLARLPDEVEQLGLERVLIVATPRQSTDVEALAARLGARAAGIFAGAVMHTPVEVTEAAMKLVAEVKADGVVAIGGGSAIGLAKAIALRTDLPQVVVPTTYAGSEMTPILGETAGGAKTTQRTLKVLPEVVIYDVELTLSLPVAVSGVSGMNALAHAMEALYARDANPVIELMALDGIRALARALPRIAEEPRDLAARSDALYGAWLSGICLGSVGMALHHKLCHVLGGSFDLPHAETHTVVLPHAIRYNAPAVLDVMRKAAAALGVEDAARGLFDLAGRVGARRALKDLGMQAADVDKATELALASPYWNPRPLEREGVRALLARAFEGGEP
jgi:maleylacetate reductase